MMSGSRRIAALLVLACTVSLGVTACSAAEDSAEPGGSWTVLTYEIADTNLEPFMMDDVTEMGAVGTQDNLNIVSFVDRAEGYTDTAVLGIDDWVGAKMLQVDDGSAEVLEDMGDVNTGDPQLLADFITRGFTDYPADNYALIISDHGASWPGVGGDESSESDSLSLAEIGEAISGGLDGASVEKLDLLGFDACLMATYEVASAMAPLADRMVASQELEPGHGWDYNALQVAADDGGATVDELGSAIIDGFEAQAKEQGDDSEITLAMIDLTAMGAVDSALSTFSQQLVDRAADVSPVVGRTLAQTLGFGRNPDPAQDTHMTDLGILAGEIGVDALDVSDAADDLVRAINDAVVDRVDGQSTKGATGLSIYFPPQADYYSAAYNDLADDGGWKGFLSTYYSAGEEIPAEEQAQFTDSEATVEFDADGVNISGAFDIAAQDNLAEGTIRYGLVQDDNSISYIGEEPATVSDDGSGLATGSFDLTSLVISDEEDAVDAYLQLSSDESSGTIAVDVPMAYYSAEDIDGETYQDALLSLTLDADSGDLLSEMYYSYDPELGTYGELTADPTGIIVPEVLNVLDDGTQEWTATSDSGLYADLPSLSYDLQALPSGSVLYLELTVTDFGGNSDSVSATVEVP